MFRGKNIGGKLYDMFVYVFFWGEGNCRKTLTCLDLFKAHLKWWCSMRWPCSPNWSDQQLCWCPRPYKSNATNPFLGMFFGDCYDVFTKPLWHEGIYCRGFIYIFCHQPFMTGSRFSISKQPRNPMGFRSLHWNGRVFETVNLHVRFRARKARPQLRPTPWRWGFLQGNRLRDGLLPKKKNIPRKRPKKILPEGRLEIFFGGVPLYSPWWYTVYTVE